MRRVAVVTGGASGIGRSIAHHLARRGDPVAIVDVDGEGAQRVAEELLADGGQALVCQADVSDPTQVGFAMQAVRSELGSVGILVTSAAIAPPFEPFAGMTLELWNRVIAVNLTGTFLCAQAAIPDMVEAGWGRAVLISSAAAQLGAPGMAQYAAAKGGVIALTKTLAREYAALGVTVNNLAPLVVDTPSVRRKQAAGTMPSNEVIGTRIPVGRIGRGDDIAAACAFLCSEEASYITGQTVSVNGGAYVGA
jgi:2-hydroxycyclohexanecarboxyl-CoA dehydrogenase